MSRNSAWAVAAAAVLAAVAGPAALASVDDLEVVKRAVGGPTVTASVRAQEAPAPSAVKERRAPRSKAELRWFKVRIVEKGSKRAKVTVNLPIALVRALGDDFPVDIGHCRGRYGREGRDGRECSIRISEVLDALEEGQDLVEIDDEDTTVRVWVE